MNKIAFLFSGQGAQAVGMGQSLAESLPAARKLYDEAAQVLGFDLAKVCFEGPADQLNSTVISQPALFVTSLAALESLKDSSPEVVQSCEAAAGLSLGEYTALAFAGVLEFADALKLVHERGKAMQQASDSGPSSMVSILGLDREQVESLCDEARRDQTLQIANLLCPGNIAVSGHREACDRVAELAESAGAMRAVKLAVAGAFHTSIMAPAVDQLAAALSEVTMKKPKIPVVSNVDAQPHDDPEQIRQRLVQQLLQPVLWEDSMRYLLARDFNKFYEVGPGRVLCGLMKRIERKTPCQSVMG